MALTDQCKAAMIEHGVLMKDGKPAAAEFLKDKETLRVAIIELGEDNRFPQDFVNTFTTILHEQHHKDTLNNPASLPSNIEEIVRDALSDWFVGEIEFVSRADNPDIQIYGFESNFFMNGLSTSPLNDDPEHTSFGSEKRLIGVSTGVWEYDFFRTTISHEFGHNLGILHTDTAYFKAIAENPQVCTESDKQTLEGHPGIMGTWKGVITPSEFDQSALERIRGTPAPNPNAKP